MTRITSLRSKLQAHFFCRYAPRYLPRLKGFEFVSQMGPSPFVWSFLIPRLMPWISIRGLYNLCETDDLITSYSTSQVTSIGLYVIGSPLLHTEKRSKLFVKSFEIDSTLLQNAENLLKQAWISNYGR